MAASGHRKHLLPAVIESIEKQTLLPYKFLIYYSTEPWHLDPGWSDAPELKTALPIELKPVINLGSCRKYLFTLQQYRRCEAPVLLIDDDIVWRDDVFATLAHAYLDLNGVVTTRGWSSFRRVQNFAGDEIIDNVALTANELTAPVEVDVANSGWCTLLSPTFVLDGLFDRTLHDQYGVYYSDEVFLSAMCTARKFVVPISGKFYRRLDTDLHQWQDRITSTAKLRQLELIKSDPRRSENI
jgi:hypothetical protein